MNKPYIQKNGLRVNSDGTTIKDRKPHLKLCPNHYHPMIYGRFLFAGGTAISDGNGRYKRKPE